MGSRNSFYDEVATVDHVAPFEDEQTGLRYGDRQARTMIQLEDPQPTIPPDVEEGDYEAIELLQPEPVRVPGTPIARQPSQPPVPAVGRYTLERLLGQGTFGKVYEARDSKLGRKLALKILNPEQGQYPEIRQRFVQEAQVTACISHPGIVCVFDAGELDDLTFAPPSGAPRLGRAEACRGTAYIAMELLAGESLHARLVRRGPMSSDKVREIGRQAASALEAAHHAGIIHRDLKPENIFLVPDPAAIDGERIKVLDFGLAKPTLTASVKTQAATVFGTPAYMSPEQCESTRDIDHRSDIYSLGCVLFQLITGKMVFDGTLRELVMQHRTAAPRSIRSLVPDADPALDGLIMAMLAKDPAHRPQTMGDVARALVPQASDTDTTRDLPAIPRSIQHNMRGVKTFGVALVALLASAGAVLSIV